MSYIDDLIKIKELLDSGVLTQEDYDAQKQKILDLSYTDNVEMVVEETEIESPAEIEASVTDEIVAEATSEAEEIAAETSELLDAVENNDEQYVADSIKDSYEANKQNYQAPPAYQSAQEAPAYGNQQNEQQYYQQDQFNNNQVNEPQQYSQPYGQNQYNQSYGQQQYNQPYGQNQYNQSYEQQGYQEYTQYAQPQGYSQVPPNDGQPYNRPIVQKSRVAAGMLGIFLGCLGVHNFYLGFITKGIIQLIITVFLGWLMFIGIFIAGIWGLIEGILILVGTIQTDANGVPLKD